MPEKSNGKPQKGYAWHAVDVMLETGAACYRREVMLPRLLPIVAKELADSSEENTKKLCLRLVAALRRERGLGRAGHWTYDLNRHIGLLQAYRAERTRLERYRKIPGRKMMTPDRPIADISGPRGH